MTRDDFYLAVGANIRKARRAKRRAQKELASHLELSRESISNIENGRHAIQLHVLVETAKYLDVQIADLIPGETTATTSPTAREIFRARIMRGES